jgi:hypothetical protein
MHSRGEAEAYDETVINQTGIHLLVLSLAVVGLAKEAIVQIIMPKLNCERRKTKWLEKELGRLLFQMRTFLDHATKAVIWSMAQAVEAPGSSGACTRDT